MIRTLTAFLVMVVLLMSCDGKPTLQKYYVQHSGKPNFSTFDIAPTVINSKKLTLTENQEKALKSLHKFNVLIYSKDKNKPAEYEQEKERVKSLIKNDSYDELMKFNEGGMGASISTKGEGTDIEEFVVVMNNNESGFGVIRVLGDNMTPENVFTIAELIREAGIDKNQLKPLEQLMTNRTAEVKK